uniref:Uncharacterized protein n=1 Tax=Anguilla anguilla TaxID=7936 RepID=A0A0E9UI25_ANGAN
MDVCLGAVPTEQQPK